jgi:hypothetical protein
MFWLESINPETVHVVWIHVFNGQWLLKVMGSVFSPWLLTRYFEHQFSIFAKQARRGIFIVIIFLFLSQGHVVHTEHGAAFSIEVFV